MSWGENFFKQYLHFKIFDNKKILLSMLAILSLLLVGQTYAFGVSTPYYVNDTLKLEPGQDFQYIIVIQNIDEEEVDVSINYTADDGVAKLRERDLKIPGKSFDNEFIFDVHIPENAIPGTTYQLWFAVKPIVKKTGQIPIGIEIKRSAYFFIVTEGGEGRLVKPLPFWQKGINGVTGFIHGNGKYVLLVVLLAVFVIIGMRVWRISRQVAEKIHEERKKSPFTISQAKSIEDVLTLLKFMTNSEFNMPQIRDLLSAKFKELGENFLSVKVLKISTKEEFIKMLK